MPTRRYARSWSRPKVRALVVVFLAATVAAPVVSARTAAEAVPGGWGEATTGVRGLPKALALDRGRPRVAYHTRSGAIGYAECDAGCAQASGWRSVELVHTEPVSAIDLAVDAWGRTHLAYFDDERDGIFYATCETGCDRASAWTHAQLDDTTNEDGLSLAVDPWGRPRIAYIRSVDGTSSGLTYAACDAHCTTASSWSIVILDHWLNGRPSLALDGTKPRIATSWPDHSKGEFELRYWTCESRCLDKSSWQLTTVMNFESIGEPSLAVEGTRAHIAFNSIPSVEPTSLVYVRCESGCTSQSNWSDPVLLTPGQRALAPDLAVTAGRPRIAFTFCPGACTVFTPSNGSEVHYASCETNCTFAVNWHTQRIAADPTTWGRLALDGERPRVAYADTSGGVDDLRYVSCDAPCGAAGTWPPPPSSPPPSEEPPSGGSGPGGAPGGNSGGGLPSPGAVTTGPGGSSPGLSASGTGADSGANANGGPGGRASTARRSAGVDASVAASGALATADGNPRGTDDGGGAIKDLGRSLARAPGAALDVITNPSRMLSWSWGRISLSVLAVVLLGLATHLVYVEGMERHIRWRARQAVGGR